MIFFKIFLIPFSLIYGLIIWLRNKFFDFGILRSRSFDLPIISVGNLSYGGTGKTPHVEYIINLIGDSKNNAVLSRGYRRNTKGFYLVENTLNYKSVGDEPLQLSNKFKNTIIAVCEDRLFAIKKLINMNINFIILDDAFQYRYLDPGMNILLTTYQNLYINDFLLPFGSLRESKSAFIRASTIIVTKTPRALLPVDKKRLIEQIAPWPHQKLFFSFYEYHKPKHVFSSKEISFDEQKILLLTGICDPQPIKDYLLGKVELLKHLKYPDHYEYKEKDIVKIKEVWTEIQSSEKIILTTEKDCMRLKMFKKELENLPIYYLPISVNFHEKEKFNNLIIDYVKKNKGDF
tara:strand:- start:245 stop:1285 length:1041 start_codon:yes stop_codon:yes gene_type:complete